MNRKWNLQSVKNLFDEAGCVLISGEYVNAQEKLKYVATCGHEGEISLDNFKAGKGRLCKKCRYRKIGDQKLNTFNQVKEEFEKNGCKLLSTQYINSREKLDYIAQCGHKNAIAYNKFISGAGKVCNKCSKSIRYGYDYVAECFENEGCILLEEEYVNCKTPMNYIAQCGHEAVTTFDIFLNSNAPKRCKDCQKINHYSIENVRQIFESENCRVLSKAYKNKQKIKYIAQCGHQNEITLSHFLSGQGRNCRDCCKPSGESHHNYNPNLTDADRIANRDLFENIAWRKQVVERDQYVCQCCGYDKGNILVAHHLNGYADHSEERLDISNGITLCKDCHHIFHMKYGYGNNTKEQFIEFIQGINSRATPR